MLSLIRFVPRPRRCSAPSRTFAAAAACRDHFIVIAKDGKDAGALDRRLKVREEHLARNKESFDKGISVLGGATLDPETGKMSGSVLILDVPTFEDAAAYVRSDPYVTGDVWRDYEILPFKLARMRND
ncbi:hypothetical protein HK101_012073 [Irineochytrium annulatum]|nr:hypothetical protein HK101_012073 [Irineochytrium annulatum]